MIKRNVLNKLLLLRLIQLGDNAQINGATRLQKLVFEIERSSRRIRRFTFNYKFIRWYYGPYSSELKEDIEFLIERGYILYNAETKTYSLTELGEEKITQAENIYAQIRFNEMAEGTIRVLNSMSLTELLETVYENHRIPDYRMGEVIEPVRQETI